MQLTFAGQAQGTRDAAARQQWLANCEAAYAPVYRALIAMGATRDDAADALQDAFEQALRQRTPIRRADGWLYMVANRKWRRARWRRRILRPLDAARLSMWNDRDPEIDLVRELGRLTERQRTVVVSRYVLGLSQREIGELLAIAPGTVAATVHQATVILRERLIGGPK